MYTPYPPPGGASVEWDDTENKPDMSGLSLQWLLDNNIPVAQPRTSSAKQYMFLLNEFAIKGPYNSRTSGRFMTVVSKVGVIRMFELPDNFIVMPIGSVHTVEGEHFLIYYNLYYGFDVQLNLHREKTGIIYNVATLTRKEFQNANIALADLDVRREFYYRWLPDLLINYTLLYILGVGDVNLRNNMIEMSTARPYLVDIDDNLGRSIEQDRQLKPIDFYFNKSPAQRLGWNDEAVKYYNDVADLMVLTDISFLNSPWMDERKQVAIEILRYHSKPLGQIVSRSPLGLPSPVRPIYGLDIPNINISSSLGHVIGSQMSESFDMAKFARSATPPRIIDAFHKRTTLSTSANSDIGGMSKYGFMAATYRTYLSNRIDLAEKSALMLPAPVISNNKVLRERDLSNKLYTIGSMKSALQKYIRRGIFDKACMAAAEMWNMEKINIREGRTSMFNRLSVIAVEDIGVAGIDTVQMAVKLAQGWSNGWTKSRTSPQFSEVVTLIQYMAMSVKTRVMSHIWSTYVNEKGREFARESGLNIDDGPRYGDDVLIEQANIGSYFSVNDDQELTYYASLFYIRLLEYDPNCLYWLSKFTKTVVERKVRIKRPGTKIAQPEYMIFRMLSGLLNTQTVDRIEGAYYKGRGDKIAYLRYLVCIYLFKLKPVPERVFDNNIVNYWKMSDFVKQLEDGDYELVVDPYVFDMHSGVKVAGQDTGAYFARVASAVIPEDMNFHVDLYLSLIHI